VAVYVAVPVVTTNGGAGGVSSTSGTAPCVVQTKLAVAVLTPSVAETTTL